METQNRESPRLGKERTKKRISVSFMARRVIRKRNVLII